MKIFCNQLHHLHEGRQEMLSRVDPTRIQSKGQQMLAFFDEVVSCSMRIHLLGRFNHIACVAICTIEKQIQHDSADRSQQNA